MFPISLPTWAAAKLFFKSKKFLIPFATLLLLGAIGGGTYAYLKHSTHEAVQTAVKAADSNATIKSYQTKDIITTRAAEVDRKFDRLHDRTTQDYTNARSHLETAPSEARDAQAPSVIVDTLNELDRLHGERDEGGVLDSDVPVG